MVQDLPFGQIAGYKLLHPLGRGGMGVVYLAESIEKKNNKQDYVAVKLIRTLANDDTMANRFVQEMRSLDRLRGQQNIVYVRSYGDYEGLLYIITDYYPGGTLADLQNASTRLSTERIIRILRDVANGLDTAHRKKIIHRDIKPSNILFDKSYGTAYVSDFGIAKSSLFDESITPTRGQIGTMAYMAPELFDGESATVASDLYSFGVLAYDILTGQPPKRDTSSYRKLMAWHHNPEKPLLSELDTSISKSVAVTVNKMISVDPAFRYKSAGEFVRALEDALLNPAETEILFSVSPSTISDPQEIRHDKLFSSPPDFIQVANPPAEEAGNAGFVNDEPSVEADPDIEEVDSSGTEFTAFYPDNVTGGQFYGLMAFVHLALPPVRQEIEKIARQYNVLMDNHPAREAVVSAFPIAGEVRLTFVPQVEGITFEPSQYSVTWLPERDRYQKALFVFQTPPELTEDLTGQIVVLNGPLIMGRIPLTMHTGNSASTGLSMKARLHEFDVVFASYSHKDAPVMEYFRRQREKLGQKMLVDIYDLRVGDPFDKRLMEMIDQCSIFQLFWSENSANSSYCRKEWQYALQYVDKRPRFIQPVWWEDPRYEPPEELAQFHFLRVELPADLRFRVKVRQWFEFYKNSYPNILFVLLPVFLIGSLAFFMVLNSRNGEETILTPSPAETSTIRDDFAARQTATESSFMVTHVAPSSTPTERPTATRTPTIPTLTPTDRPTATGTPTVPTRTPTDRPTLTPSVTATLTPSVTSTATFTLTPIPSVTPTEVVVVPFVPSGNILVSGLITNQQYEDCENAGSCIYPSSAIDRFRSPLYDNEPVVGITWFNAQQFCRAMGGRLPLAGEWETIEANLKSDAYREWLAQDMNNILATVEAIPDSTMMSVVGIGREAIQYPADFHWIDIGFRCVLNG